MSKFVLIGRKTIYGPSEFLVHNFVEFNHYVCYNLNIMQEKTLIIIPTYNEKENIDVILGAIFASAPKVNVLFVDDNSPDGTGELIDAHCEKNPQVHVLHRSEKSGLGRAYIAGFKWGLEQGYEYLFEMDADMSHDPKEIPAFLEKAKECDLVLGTRYKGGIRVINWPLNRLIISMGAGMFVRMVTALPVSDPTGGYKCFNHKVLESIELDKVISNGYSFQIEMTHNAWMRGFSIGEVPIVFEDRRYGFSKLSKAIAREAFGMVFRLAWRNRFRRRQPNEKKQLALRRLGK